MRMCIIAFLIVLGLSYCSVHQSRFDSNKIEDSMSIDTLCEIGYKISLIDSFPEKDFFKDQKKRFEITNKDYYAQPELENYYFENIDSSIAYRNHDSLFLILDNNAYLKIFNLNTDSITELYTLEFDFKVEGYYLLFCQFYEGNSYVLVSKKSGNMTWICGLPYFSPNKKTIVTVSGGVCGADYNFSGIQIFKNNNGELTQVLECEYWFANYVEWISNSEFKVAKAFANPNCQEYLKFYKVKMPNTH